MYADYTRYQQLGGVLDEDTAVHALERASDAVDILTFNRIRAAGGISALTDFRRQVVEKVVCRLADWQESNSDALGSPYKSYSINGVSASVGASDTVQSVAGVLVPREIYSLLKTTGLCLGVIT